MKISVHKLLSKIESELKDAKECVKEENLREKVYSIKILCELLLDEKQTKSDEPLHTKTIMQPMTAPPTLHQPVSLNQPKKLEMDDGANGESLFDF
jgi:hypothetical protein